MSKYCKLNMYPGWKCILWEHKEGPCGLVPRWWNLVDRWKFRKNLNV